VTGISVATIDRVEGFKLPEYSSATRTEIGHEIRRITSWINLREPFEKDSKDLLAFCRTIYVASSPKGTIHKMSTD